MLESPIAYSNHEIRAFLKGRKQQTRQIVRSESGEIYHADHGALPACPYGQPGDRIWVQESGIVCALAGYTAQRGIFRHDVPTTPESGHYWVERTRSTGASYNVSGCSRASALLTRGAREIAAADMPRWACRILLEISSVRVERLQAISEADAIAEGIIPAGDRANGRQFWRDYRLSGDGTFCVMTPEESFRSLWKALNGEESWDINPLVWVIDVARLPNVRVIPPQDHDLDFLNLAA